ncbi:kinase-like protein [Hypoxylon crocopeplum]|nr:kinase-like protein [Hypoxylon crocopeplum]
MDQYSNGALKDLSQSKHTPCSDRGNGFRLRSQTSARRSNQSLPQHSKKLYNALWQSKITYSRDENKSFIPYEKLELAKDDALVEQALRHPSSGISKSQVPILLKRICSNHKPSFFRIFAILVLCKNVRYIAKFIDLQVDDSYLPLPTIRRTENGITPWLHKHGPKLNRETLEDIFQDEDDWDHGNLSTFNTCQWWTIAPFFDRLDNEIPHYLLEANDVFPFTKKKEVKTESLDTDVEELIKEGGFGEVSIVEIHPSHHGFADQLYNDGSHSFAIKRLKSPSAGDFKLEVDALRKYNYGIENHLIPLLATIEKDDDAGKYYMLFPKADGDLHHFWKTQFSQKTDGSLLRWMAKQCLGLTEALSMLHQDQDADKEEDYPIYGRHGDIKAANILWFSKRGVTGSSGWCLVLADFGLMRFHRLWSRSIQTARNLKKTITYQAPEFDIAKISRKSDIWALGCTFLEFVTCYLLGYQAVNEDFPTRRGEYDERLKLDADKFYRTTNGGEWAELKPSVQEWISNLHQNPNCSPYLHDFLFFIEKSMLCIERDKRPTASKVAQELKSLYEKCEKDSYVSGRILP